MTNELSTTETKNLKTCEKIIERTRHSFLECGMALARVRDEKLYREYFDSFQDYCKERWGWDRTYAHRLIEAAEVVQSLPKNVAHGLQNERQARELGKVEPENRAKVFEEASRNGHATAKSIQEAAQEKIIELDEIGHPVPDEILQDWTRATVTGKELLRMASDLKCEIDRYSKEEDLIFREVNSSTVAYVQNVYRACKQIVPYAVCPVCQGHSRSKCTLCKQRGFISKFLYENALPKEVKEIREKTGRK